MAATTSAPPPSQRRLILSAAGEMFSRRPYEQVNVGEVARLAGVARTLVFYYFKDKRGLYVATLTALLADLDRFVAPTGVDQEPETLIRETLTKYFEYLAQHPSAMVALLRAGQQDPELAIPYESARQLGIGRILAVLDVDSAESRPVLRTAVRGWTGFTDAVAGDWLAHDQDLPVARCVDLCFDALISSVDSAEGHRPEPVGLARRISRPG